MNTITGKIPPFKPTADSSPVETIVMREIEANFLQDIIEFCENEVFEWEVGGKGKPTCDDIIEFLKDYRSTYYVTMNNTFTGTLPNLNKDDS